MPVRPVLRMGDPLLNAVSEPVSQADIASPGLHAIVQDMLDTMRACNGAGIAAIQIGIPKRIMIFEVTKNPRYPDAPPIPLTAIVNPIITVLDATPCEYFEGCLSVPGLRGPVLRPSAVRYTGVTPDGTPVSRDVSGFHARVVQHENDHLDGILFPRRVADHSRFGFTEELERGGVIPAIAVPALPATTTTARPASKL